jgi:hypothetical protein
MTGPNQQIFLRKSIGVLLEIVSKANDLFAHELSQEGQSSRDLDQISKPPPHDGLTLNP